MRKGKEKEKKIIEGKYIVKQQILNMEIMEKGKELSIIKNKANARKQQGIKQFHSITIEVKKPVKFFETQHPLTIQLLKDMQSPQNGSFAISGFSMSL